MILVEKYRPKSFTDGFLVKTKPIVDLENRLQSGKEFPHLLFSGDSGTGKTTIAHILIRELTGEYDTRIKDLCLDLNASDARKIGDVRGKIKEYAQVRNIYSDKQFIFLDEVDNMTRDAQTALRRIMEDYSKNCMFILSCNYPEKLIQPLKSRCSHYKFPRPTVDELVPVVGVICKKENINIEVEAIREIVEQLDCDIREVINWIDGHSGNLQITKEDIQIVTEGDKLLRVIQSKSNDLIVYDQIQSIVTNSDANCLIRSIFKVIINDYKHIRGYIAVVEKLAESHYRALGMSNTDGQLQLYDFCLFFRKMIMNDESKGEEIGELGTTPIPNYQGTPVQEDKKVYTTTTNNSSEDVEIIDGWDI